MLRCTIMIYQHVVFTLRIRSHTNIYSKLINPANPTPTTPAATRTPFLSAPLELLGCGGFGGVEDEPGVEVVFESVELAELLGTPLVANVPAAVDLALDFVVELAELAETDADAARLEMIGATSVITRVASPARRDETYGWRDVGTAVT